MTRAENKFLTRFGIKPINTVPSGYHKTQVIQFISRVVKVQHIGINNHAVYPLTTTGRQELFKPFSIALTNWCSPTQPANFVSMITGFIYAVLAESTIFLETICFSSVLVELLSQVGSPVEKSDTQRWQFVLTSNLGWFILQRSKSSPL
jgi:hypothetical protein